MQLKFVYVLTCPQNCYYIEWALLSLYSLRRLHRNAYTVLVTDNDTNSILVGKRSEILRYVSEKVVISDFPFDMSSKLKSRFLKTSVREYLSGDFLFIDCDTLICKPLNDIEDLSGIHACKNCHLSIHEYSTQMYDKLNKDASVVGWDISKEDIYYSSGVMFVQDTPVAYELYKSWHNHWLKALNSDIYQDQLTLALANIDCNYTIQLLPDTYNCVVFTQNSFVREAHILHISSYENTCYLYTDKVLEYVKNNGCDDSWVKWIIEHPYGTILPFDYEIYHSSIHQKVEWINEIAEHMRRYAEHIDDFFVDFPMKSHIKKIVITCYRMKLYKLGSFMWLLWKQIHIITKKRKLNDNILRK